MPNLNFSHQENIFDPNLSKPISVIGVGSVGSFVVLALAKMGVTNITVYDADYVESHNIPMSAYRICDLGLKKVEALKNIVKEHTGTEIKAIPEMYTDQRISTAIISCVDTMEARQMVFEKAKINPLVDLLIDTRIGQEFISIFAIEPHHPEEAEYYKYYLRYGTDETMIIRCGLHGISPISMRAASVVCANLINFWKNGKKYKHYEELGISLQRVDQEAA